MNASIPILKQKKKRWDTSSKKSRKDAQTWMDCAADLAWKGLVQVESNPMVGAVLIRNNQKIGEGYHRKFGGPHAEIEAVMNAQKKGLITKGSTLVVTLEPCCHDGKTPPCVKALIQAGIKKVIYAQIDPNPKMAGKAIRILEQNGIHVECIATQKSEALNERYLKNQTWSLPFVHIKTACTLDGKITLKTGEKTMLTSKESTQKVHEIRSHHDAILIGIGTLKSDDPRLTSRIPKGKNPIRIVVDSTFKTSQNAQIFKEKGQNIIATTIHPRTITYKLPKNTTLLQCKKTKKGQVDLKDMLKKLYKNNIRSILVEGGEKINTSFLEADLVDRLTLIITPHYAGNKKLPQILNWKSIKGLAIKRCQWFKMGEDFWMEGQID